MQADIMQADIFDVTMQDFQTIIAEGSNNKPVLVIMEQLPMVI